MLSSFKKNLVLIRNYLIFRWYDILAKLRSRQFEINPKAKFVVSIASYPKRDELLPAVFEALDRQTVKPLKWILVLSEEEYRGGQLPSYLKKLERRGLEILWVTENPYAIKKLLPVMKKYPKLGVVTLDDDVIYHHSLLGGLLLNEFVEQECVVGFVGKAKLKKNQELKMYLSEPEAATTDTPPEQVYLIGWGGIYYPPNSLHPKATDMTAVHRIVPGRGSDIWFWAAAHANNTKQVCLGKPDSYKLGIPIPQTKNSEPRDTPGSEEMNKRFQMTIDYFEIREKLMEELPDKREWH